MSAANTTIRSIKLDEGFDLAVDETGDLGFRSGADALEQTLAAVTSSVLDAQSGIGGTGAGRAEALIERQIETTVASLAYVTTVRNVSVGTLRDGTLSATVTVESPIEPAQITTTATQ